MTLRPAVCMNMTITVGELVKVAEELGKPIIWKTPDYYVFDGSMRYECRSVVIEEATGMGN